MGLLKKMSAVIFIVLFLGGCRMGEEAVVTIGVSLEPDNGNIFDHQTGKWTVILYMPADNDMEKAAMQDLNEMEAADYDFDGNHVLALVDTNRFREGYDGEWSGTRLYEVRHDKNGINGRIASLRLGCSELGLSSRFEREVDMSDPKVLEKYVSTVASHYPAEHYAFVMCGECSGYTGNRKSSRALAFDDSNISYMTNMEFAASLAKGLGKKFDILAMDTCFASELELLSEFDQCAKWFVGVEGLQKKEGFDYSAFLNSLADGCDDGRSFGRQLMKSQEEKNLSLVDLSKINGLCSEFDLCAKEMAASIMSTTDAEKRRDEILKSNFCFRTYESSVNPVYADVRSLAEKFGLHGMLQSLEETVECSDSNYGGIGVFFCNTDRNQNVMQEIPEDYVKNKNKSNCSFVNKWEHYVFTQEKKGSLLDKLFGNYNSF